MVLISDIYKHYWGIVLPNLPRYIFISAIRLCLEFRVLLTRKPVYRMSKPKPTIQDIFLKFYPQYLDKYTPSPGQSKVANCIINCKTGACGANVSVCEDCGHLQIHYNSCRNRCCPMCQALPKEMWMDKRREDVLEAPYFHVVFTVPQELNPLIYSNQQPSDHPHG